MATFIVADRWKTDIHRAGSVTRVLAVLDSRPLCQGRFAGSSGRASALRRTKMAGPTKPVSSHGLAGVGSGSVKHLWLTSSRCMTPQLDPVSTEGFIVCASSELAHEKSIKPLRKSSL